MAYGSVRRMRSYADKVFEKDDRLGRMTDGRRDPTLPLAAVLATWQWGLMRRTPSTEQIRDLLRDRRWRARLGLKPE
jgi:thiamine biosynthesis lipoprotein ApbE